MASNQLRDPYRDSISATETLGVLREMNSKLDLLEDINGKLDGLDAKLAIVAEALIDIRDSLKS